MSGDQLLGWAAVIGAIGVITGQIVTVITTRHTKRTVEVVSEAVKTSNGATIGQIVEANDKTGITNGPPREGP